MYQLMAPIYSLLVLVLSAGISVGLKVCCRRSAKGLSEGNKVATISAGLVLGAGIIICGILLLNLDSLVLGTTGDVRTRSSLFWILILVPPIAAASAYKGYFYGKQEMLPNSVGQIFEQIIKLAFVLTFYGHFKGKGIDSMCLLAVLALLIGEIANVIVVYIAFIIAKYKSVKTRRNTGKSTMASVKKICRTAMPISANRLVLSSIGTVENLLIHRD